MAINEETIPEVNEEAELDKILEDSINSVKAGNGLQAEPETKPEDKAEAVVEEPKPEAEVKEEIDSSTPKTEEPKADVEFRIPKKGATESDETFERRVELMDLIRRRKAAKTDEVRAKLEKQIDTVRHEVGMSSSKDKLINKLNEKVETPTEQVEEDETLKADKERLKQVGGTTVEQVQELLQKERQALEVKSTLEKFVDRHTELKDEDTREVFFDFVDSNYNWQNKSGKDLMTVLELARENMFKPSETIQERVLKGANVQEKVNAMQFPGGTVTKAAYSPEMKKSIDELVATGMSEEKALELLAD